MLEEEIRKATAGLAAAPGVPANWLMMFLLLVRKRDEASLAELIMARARSNGDPVSFLFFGLRELVAAHADSETAWLADYFGKNAALGALAERARAGLALRRGQWLEALSATRRAAAGLSVALASVPSDRVFRDEIAPQMRAQGEMLEPPETLATLPRLEAEPTMEWLVEREPEREARGCLVACGDARYMAMFGPGLVESVLRLGEKDISLHLHLVSDDEAAITTLRNLALPNTRLEATVERSVRFNTYYACSRFLVAPMLLKRHRCAVVTLDLDMVLVRPMGPVLDLVKGADVGRLRFADPPLPSMALLAGMVVLNPTAGAEEYLQRLNGVILQKLELPHNWMLDQAAMFSVERLNDQRKFCTICDLSQYLPGHVGGLVELPAHPDKLAARMANI